MGISKTCGGVCEYACIVYTSRRPIAIMSVCVRVSGVYLIHVGVYARENLRFKKNHLYNIHFLYLIHEHTL